MNSKELTIRLQEEDWAFVQSEIDRLKLEENADVTEGEVVSTLVETGIEHEMESRAKAAVPQS